MNRSVLFLAGLGGATACRVIARAPAGSRRHGHMPRKCPRSPFSFLLMVIMGLAAGTPAVIAAELTVTPSADLAAVIQRAHSNTTIVLSSGTFKLAARRPLNHGIIIENKRNFCITGQGWDKTKIKLAPDVKIGFYIGSNIENLRIQNLHIEGTLPLRVNTNAIGSYSRTTNVRGVELTGLRIENVAQGFSIATSPSGLFADVRIVGNVVARTIGTEASWGYGIHSQNARNLLISQNLIQDGTRHSIYLARAGRNANIRIENNLILNHNSDGKQSRPYSAALVCSRASAVRIAHNIIVNPRAFAISVEPDEVHGWPTENIVLVNNQVVNAHYVGIWVVTGRTHTALGNRVILHPKPPNPDLCHEVSTFHYATGKPTKSALKAPDPRWKNPDHVAELRGRVYVMKNGTLDEITPYTWSDRTCPRKWSDVTSMTALRTPGGQGKGSLYIATGDGLYEVETDTWQTASKAADWRGIRLMTSASGYLHILRDGTLYRLTPGTLDVKQSRLPWSNTVWMGTWRGYVLVFSDGALHCLDPATLEECELTVAVRGKAAQSGDASNAGPDTEMHKEIARALRMARIFELNKRFDLARKECDEVIKRYPDSPEIEPVKARLRALEKALSKSKP